MNPKNRCHYNKIILVNAFLTLYIFFTASLLLIFYANDLELIVETNAYGNICENIELSYSFDHHTEMLMGTVDYKRENYRFLIKKLDTYQNLHDLVIQIFTFPEQNLDSLPLLNISSIKIRCGKICLVQAEINESQFTDGVNQLEAVDFQNNFCVRGYTPQIFLNSNILNVAITNLKILQKVLFITNIAALVVFIFGSCPKAFPSCRKKMPSKHADCFFLICAITVYALISTYYLMGNPCYDNDEKYVMEAAVGWLNTGELRLWDFVKNTGGELYNRASIYTYIVAFAFKFFGVSVLTARAVSVVFGALFVIILYIVLRVIRFDSQQSFITCILIILNPNLTVIFRTARMYSMSMPLSLLMIYWGYRAITQRNHFSKNNTFSRIVSKYFDFNLGYLFLFMLITFFNLWCVPNTMLILVGMFFFLVYAAMRKKEKRYTNICLLVVVCLFLLGLVYILFLANVINNAPFIVMQLLYIIKEHFQILGKVRYTYILTDLSSFGNSTLGVCLLLSSIIFVWKKQRHSVEIYFLKYICFVLTGAYLYFVFFSDLSPAYRYMCFVQPISYILISYLITGIFQKTYLKIWTIGFVFLSAVLTFQKNADIIYAGNSYVTNFINAYQTLQGYEAKRDILMFPSWYQSYYLQDFDSVDLVNTYMFDERKSALIDTFGGCNYDLLLNSVTENTEGYISFETRKLYMWKYTYPRAEALFEKIAGTGFDTDYLELYKFNILYPVRKEVPASAKKMIDHEYIDIYIHEENASSDLHFLLKNFPDMNQNKLIGITLNVGDRTEKFQLYISDWSTTYQYENLYVKDIENIELIDICGDH